MYIRKQTVGHRSASFCAHMHVDKVSSPANFQRNRQRRWPQRFKSSTLGSGYVNTAIRSSLSWYGGLYPSTRCYFLVSSRWPNKTCISNKLVDLFDPSNLYAVPTEFNGLCDEVMCTYVCCQMSAETNEAKHDFGTYAYRTYKVSSYAYFLPNRQCPWPHFQAQSF